MVNCLAKHKKLANWSPIFLIAVFLFFVLLSLLFFFIWCSCLSLFLWMLFSFFRTINRGSRTQTHLHWSSFFSKVADQGNCIYPFTIFFLLQYQEKQNQLKKSFALFVTLLSAHSKYFWTLICHNPSIFQYLCYIIFEWSLRDLHNNFSR